MTQGNPFWLVEGDSEIEHNFQCNLRTIILRGTGSTDVSVEVKQVNLIVAHSLVFQIM